jgi:hypothetical protein
VLLKGVLIKEGLVEVLAEDEAEAQEVVQVEVQAEAQAEGIVLEEKQNKEQLLFMTI